PKLDAAIKSQKVVFNTADTNMLEIDETGVLIKERNKKEPFIKALKGINHGSSPLKWSFNKLEEQIVQECVKPDWKDNSKWGVLNEGEAGFCLSLISRIKYYSESKYLKCIIDVDESLQTIPDILDKFCLSENNDSNILRLDLSHVPFEANAREVLVNAIGKKLLSIARDSQISMDNPMLVFIDEAHQFLNKKLGDESNHYELDAFGNIAKEGRKFGLNVVIATQRPR